MAPDCSSAEIEIMRRVHPDLAILFFVVVVLTAIPVAIALRRRAWWVSWLLLASGTAIASVVVALIGIQYEDFYVECSGPLWSRTSVGSYLSMLHAITGMMGLLTYAALFSLIVRAAASRWRFRSTKQG